MPKLPKHLKLPGTLERLGTMASHQLNFYRVHMLAFTFIPIILSGVFYACNTDTHVPYIDCLFLCMSAMCVTGLTTTDLSTITTFQQFLLYAQTLLGSLIFVSLVMIYVRMYFFRAKFRHVIEEQRKDRKFNLSRVLTMASTAQPLSALRRRFTRTTTTGGDPGGEDNHNISARSTAEPAPPKKRKGPFRVDKGMIKRVDGGGVGLVNPMGWYDAASPAASKPASERGRTPSPTPTTEDAPTGRPTGGFPLQQLPTHHPDSPSSGNSTRIVASDESNKNSSNSGSDDQPQTLYKDGGKLHIVTSAASEPANAKLAPPMSAPGYRTPYSGAAAGEEAFPRSRTIAFDDIQTMPAYGTNGPHTFHRTMTNRSDGDRLTRIASNASIGMPRTYTLRATTSRKPDPKMSGYGGFPTPIRLLSDLFGRAFPKASNKLTQTLTVPRTNTISGHLSQNGEGQGGQPVPYISFAATVGRNSNFKDLTEEQMDELGGVEYRALKLLFYIVLSYWIVLPLAGACIIAPYIAAGNRYDDVFKSQPKYVRIPWFAFFQSTSAFANLGMSLVDASVVPFQKAYLMNAVVAILILCGNTCYPIMLRVIIRLTYQWVPATSRTRETLKFLLDHPRRCFVYLFPSTTTWFLACVVCILTAIDFVSFMVLDIGTPAIEELQVGTRIAAGLFQSVAVRAAGFVIVPMNSLAPAVKILFVIMMYISVYPIAMSVRSTNVYEERSLGLFEEHEDEEEEEEQLTEGRGATAVAKYLGWHARRQLAFDMWWIAASLWIVCIIERPHLNDPANYEFFNVFNVVFELVSAYGTVGLSLGLPNNNYSLSGGMRTLSKLVICAVMLRGRHRGLPVAIDRAVMLPRDFTASDEAAFEERLRRSRSRQNTSMDNVFSNTFTSTTGMTDMNDSDSEPRGRGRTGSISIASLPRRDSSRGPPVPQRRDSSPSAIMRQTSHPMVSTPQEMTPTASSITFALNRAAVERSGSISSTVGDTPTRPSGTGFLTPVREMSRRPTMTEEPKELAEFRQRSQQSQDPDPSPPKEE